MELLELKEVSKHFGSKKVLENVSFSLEKGRIVGIVGPSGAGKSVFIKILIGFLSPDSGNVFLNSSRMGFSMQDNSLYEYLTVKQNLVYFSRLFGVQKKYGKLVIPWLISQLNLKDFEKVLVKNLSGGTKKRVDIACSLINDPDIVILDEPFIGLDPALIQTLSKFIVSLNKKGKTILISSHRVKELSSICSKIFLIKNKSLRQIDKSKILNAYS